MQSETEPLAVLARALDQTADLLDALRPDQAALATPCASWDVSRLVSHLINDLTNFTASAQGEAPDWSRPTPEYSPEEWGPAFRSGAAGLLDTWRRAALEALVPSAAGQQPLARRVDHQIAELATHDWDLARASGQPAELDSEVATRGLDWARRNLRPEFRGSEEDGKAFGPEVAVASDASVYDQLAAWFGRDPNWSP